MFLDWTAKIGLLEHDPESNILKDFALPVKRVIVQQVVTFLLDNSNGSVLLTSPTHVHWAMEVIAQGFTLPIEDEDIIKQCIEIYRNWALEGKRPPAIDLEFQFFIRV
jgi:hypothetical protein